MSEWMVTVPARRLVALRTMAWAGMHLVAGLSRLEDADARLDDEEREVAACFIVDRWHVDNAREAMDGLAVDKRPDDPLHVKDGYLTLSLGPSLQEMEQAGADDDRRARLLARFRDRTYRRLFARASYRRGLAEQIREMRLQRGWTQADLARATGKVQETISRLENPDDGSYTLKTLDRLAEAFDVALIVRFAPFGEVADWMVKLSPADLAVPDYEHDPAGVGLTVVEPTDRAPSVSPEPVGKGEGTG